jgi:predicted hydrocarbon binding protein
MAIDVAQGGISGYHNYYVPDEFFLQNEEKGQILLRDGQRAAKVTEAFMVGLHLGVEEEVGSSSGLLMYRCGVSWGLEDMKRFANRMRQEFGGGKREIWQMNPKFVWECWWWPLTIMGFGAWRLDLEFKDRDFTVVEIRNSAVAQSMKLVGKPVCHMYAGLFAGAFSFFHRTDLQSIEVQCYSMGSDVCKFLVGAEKKVNAAEFWRNEGASAQEILGKLED